MTEGPVENSAVTFGPSGSTDKHYSTQKSETSSLSKLLLSWVKSTHQGLHPPSTAYVRDGSEIVSICLFYFFKLLFIYLIFETGFCYVA